MNRQKGAIGFILLIVASGLLTYLIIDQARTQVVIPTDGFSSTWSFSTESTISTAPALYDLDGDGLLESVFGTDDGGIYAVNGEDGSELWTFPSIDAISAPPTIADLDNDNLAEVIVGNEGGDLYVFNGEDGSRLWTPPQDEYYWTGNLGFDGDLHRYSVNVGEHAAEMRMILDCGDNDYDLYVAYDFEPDTSSYDFRGYTGTGEDITTDSPDAGSWHFMIHSYSGTGAYDFWVIVNYEGDVTEDVVVFGNALEAEGEEEVHSINVPEGGISMHLVLECGSNDFDLYGGLGYIPTSSSYDFRGFSTSGEDLTIDSPNSGTWYLMVRAYSGSGPYTLTVTVATAIEPMVTISGYIEAAPVAVDLENDGETDVIVGTTTGALYALEGLSGRSKWSYFSTYKIACSPVIADVNKDGVYDVIVGDNGGEVAAVSGITGLPIWEAWVSGYSVRQMVAADLNSDSYTDIILGVGACRVMAIDGRDGTNLWYTKNYDGVITGLSIQNTVHGEFDVIFGNDLGEIYSIRGTDGSQKWTKALASAITANPTIADVTGDGNLETIVGTADGSVVALSNLQANVLWNITFPNPIDSAIAIGDLGTNTTLDLVVGCEDGTLHSIQLKESGSRIFWQGQGGASDFSRVGSMEILDTDGDMLTRYSERFYRTSINNNDTDGDQILDGRDVSLGLSPILQDSDFDGLDDFEETYIYLTSGSNPDTDFDLLMDSLEINVYFTDPRVNDSDSDHLIDGLEVLVYGSDPTLIDTDHDSLTDGMEATVYGSSPILNDTDFDLISDYDEVIVYDTNPNASDSDQDELSDYLEIFVYFSDPNLADSDSDGALDGSEIYDLGTEVNLPDTDLDSYPDGWEAAFGFDPLSAVVPVQETIMYMGVYLIAIFAVAVIGIGIYTVRREPKPKREVIVTQEPDPTPTEPDIVPPRKDMRYDLMDDVQKPWLYDGRESVVGEDSTHDFMQWLIHEERHAQSLIESGKHREAQQRLEKILSYVNQEKDKLTEQGPRTYLRTVERIEKRIHDLRTSMN
ncbi:MAG: outer membrane protein assembly factor BamB family protein [Candidatus Thorarchaeota archaeon]|jgi:outer membrane protein assembly factor BamB